MHWPALVSQIGGIEVKSISLLGVKGPNESAANGDAVAQVGGLAKSKFDKANWLNKRCALFEGDAFETLRGLPSESVNCVVTSPPYFWLRDYGVDGQIGLEDTVSDYVENVCQVFEELYRVLRRDGLAFLNLGDTYYSGKGEPKAPDKKSSKRRFGLRAVDRSGGLGIGIQRKSLIGIPWRVGLELMSLGWVLRSTIIWHRDNKLREFVRDRPSRSYEYIFMLARDRRYHFDSAPLIDMNVEQDVWTISASTKGGIDTAPFPDELVKRCLKIGCKNNGVVLDPFMGSGTTVEVAIQEGHFGVGIDLNAEFCKHVAEQVGVPRNCTSQ